MEFWQKNLYSLWFAQFIAGLGLNLIGPFLPFYLRDLGIEGDKSLKIWSGVAYAAPFVVSAFMQPLWGILGDRLGRKPMIVRAMLGLSLANVLMGFAQSAPQFVFFRLLQGFLSGFIAPSLALMASSTPAEKTGYALGTLQTALISSLIMGPMIGGVFMHLTGLRPIFFATGFLCLAGAIIVSLYVREEFAPVTGSGKVQLKNNFYHIFRSSELRSMFFLLVLVQFSIFFLAPFISLYVEYLQVQKQYVGIITGIVFGITGLTSTFSAPFWGKRSDMLGNKKILRIATCGMIAFLLPQAFVTNAYQLMFLRAGLGLFASGTIPVINSIVRHATDEKDRGGVYGIFQSGYLVGNLIGPLAGGLLSAILGLRAIFLITTACVCLAPLLIRAVNDDRRPHRS
jgi:DHA1 family multidrug resistance protein-like MFS transporter